MKRNPILIIADTENINRYASFSLSGETFARCVLNEGLDAIRRKEIDGIVLDCGLHVFRGLRILKSIKALCPGVPVIFLTDQGSETAAILAFRSGARDYFSKPECLFEIKASLQLLLSWKRLPQGKRNQFDLDRPAQGKSQRDVLPDIDASDFFLPVIQYIQENLPMAIKLGCLADKANLSKYHFCRMFKKSTGAAPMKFVMNLRIEKAKDLLRSRNYSVVSVAFQVGFKDLSNFTKQFKKYTGMTPAFYKHITAHSHMPVLSSPPVSIMTKRTSH